MKDKKTIHRTAIFAVIFMLGFLVPRMVQAAIEGSPHDFSTRNWNPSEELCNVCHTPHNAEANGVAPLWNHETTVATFTEYKSSSLDADVGQPSGTSKACLSCHDGTVAYDSFGGQTGKWFITKGYLIGTNLTGDHPVSFTYDTALTKLDAELNDPSATMSGLGGTVEEDLLTDGKVECSSCHAVHNDGPQGLFYLLVKDNKKSALCFTCHNK